MANKVTIKLNETQTTQLLDILKDTYETNNTLPTNPKTILKIIEAIENSLEWHHGSRPIAFHPDSKGAD